jgi:ribonucleoside-diphosphate reductase alpha chain
MDQYQKYIHLSRYARFMPEEKRRETWEETVNRYINFFKNKIDNENIPWDKIKEEIFNLEVMPSMRALMTAGKALERDEMSSFNCSYLPIDHLRSFDEILYILSCGAGVGFSVERQYINKLPEVPDQIYPTDTTIVVADSKIGWASSYRQLIAMLYAGDLPKWDLSRIRPSGARLKTFGGRASGPAPLDDLFLFTINKFKNAVGRKLNSIECHDIICKIAESIVTGGVRRSALLSLTNLTDERMQRAKMGNFWDLEPQRQLANISTCYTERPDMSIFMREWSTLHESGTGERGIFNRVAAEKLSPERREKGHEWGTNPCSEIILRPNQVCNLSEVVIRENDTKERLLEKVKIATIIGTLQSTLVNFRYVRNIWKQNTEEERLLGVSLTGIMDHKILSKVSSRTESWLNEMKQIAIDTNKEYATILGIPQSAAITTAKPSGCTTLDTKIRTENGVLSMAEIFSEYSNTTELLDLPSQTWLNLNKSLRVYDENGDLQYVTNLFVNGISEIYEIEFEDGTLYKFTGNHKLKTKNGWKRVDCLTGEDEIISVEEEFINV